MTPHDQMQAAVIELIDIYALKEPDKERIMSKYFARGEDDETID